MNRRNALTTLAVTLSLASVCTRQAMAQSPYWTAPVAVATGNLNYTSLALDPAGNPAIAYVVATATGTEIRCAWRVTGLWRVETVAPAGTDGAGTSLAFGPDGQPAISYCHRVWKTSRYSTAELRYASRSATGVWSVATVIGRNVTGTVSSIAFDPAGNPSIAYADIYCHRSNGIWQTESAGVSLGYTSLAYDPLTGQPAMAGRDTSSGSAGQLTFARRTPAGWARQVADAPGGYYASLAFDSVTGLPCAAHYLPVTGASVHIVLWNGSAWIVERVVWAGCPSLTTGPDGSLYASYGVGSKGDLTVDTRTPAGDWSSELVVPGGHPDSYAPVKLNPYTGLPSIAWNHSGTLWYVEKVIQ